MMEFVCYSTWEELPDSANTLFALAEQHSLFFSRPWFENLVNNSLEDDQFMLLACVIDADNTLALLPLIRRENDDWHALSNLYTSLYSLLLAEGDQQSALACLAQGLSQLPFKHLRLEPAAENDSNLQALQQAMHACGFDCYRYPRFHNWSHQLQGQTFAEYMKARPGHVRNTIERKQRKLAREQDYEIRLFTDADLDQALTDYQASYKSSWKANERNAGFIPALVKTMSRAGWLRLAILYIAGNPVAGQIWFVVHRKASIFRLAYDMDWKRYSPGSILTRYLMQHVIDTDKVEEIDFLTGNERYKQDWMSQGRQRWGLHFVKCSEPKGRIEQFIDSLKGFLNRKWTS